jgi:hypothetical protein
VSIDAGVIGKPGAGSQRLRRVRDWRVLPAGVHLDRDMGNTPQPL